MCEYSFSRMIDYYHGQLKPTCMSQSASFSSEPFTFYLSSNGSVLVTIDCHYQQTKTKIVWKL